jgi:hypothetical protein
MARDGVQAFAGLAFAGIALFSLYSGGEKVYRWCAKPDSLTYRLKSDRAVFESPNGRQEILVRDKSRKAIEQLILEREAEQKKPLSGYEVYQLYRGLDVNNDSIITPEEASLSPVARQYVARQ